MNTENVWVIVSGDSHDVWQSTGFYLNLPEGHPDRGEIVYHTKSSREVSSMPAVSYDTALLALKNWYRQFGQYVLPDDERKHNWRRRRSALYNIMDDTLIPVEILF